MAPDGPTLAVAWLGRLAYGTALALQQRLHSERVTGLRGDTLLLLEHPPVVTAGRGTSEQELQVARQLLANTPLEVVECQRGGRLTYHGPGQLVAYPIVHLDCVGRDLHRWLWVLEEAVLRAVRRLGLAAERGAGGRGVWAGGRKIASLGVAVRRWVSFHGVAINVRVAWPLVPVLTWCGLSGEKYASLADFGLAVGLRRLGGMFARELASLCGHRGIVPARFAAAARPSAREELAVRR
jgi:lipoyl(octanoyl) transferase